MKIAIEKFKRWIAKIKSDKDDKKENINNLDIKVKIKKKSKSNYDKFVFKSQELPELFKSFKIHFMYTYKKLLKGKMLWIVSFLTAILYMFIWRGAVSGVPSGIGLAIAPLAVTTILALTITIALPILAAYFISRAYRDERDRGSLLFLVTKKDHKSVVYFSKYIGAILATWTWLLIYLLFIIFWILLKVALVQIGWENFLVIFGSNPSTKDFVLMINVSLIMCLLSLFVIIFWSSLFFLLSRFLNSRGVVMSSMLVPMTAIIFPIIGNYIVGFGSHWGINSMPKGEHEYVQHTTNEYAYCNIKLSKSFGVGEWNSSDIISRNNIYADPNAFSYWDINLNSEINKPTINDIVGLEYNYFNTNICNSNYIKSNDYFNSNLFVDNPALTIESTYSSMGRIKPAILDRNEYQEKRMETIQYKWSNKEYDIGGVNFNDAKKNNSIGWLSFLNPMYYTASLLEQPQYLLIPKILRDTDLTNNIKFLSSTFGGKHNVKYSIKEKYEDLENKSYLGYKISGSISSGGRNFFNDNYVSSRSDISHDYYGDSFFGESSEGFFKIPLVNIEEAGILYYGGMEYWIHPAGIIALLSLGGLAISWLAIRLNSRHDLNRL